MRVIGGNFRGRKLAALHGRNVRPTADRVREAIFNILGPRVRGARVLDLFCGTGALGIEAMSRNASEAVFVDSAGASLNVVRKNLTLCGLTDTVRVIKWDVVKSLNPLLAYREHFDLVFLDPPYNRQMVLPPLGHLATHHLVAPDAMIIVEHDPAETIPQGHGQWAVTDTRRYGQTQVTFLTLRALDPVPDGAAAPGDA